jgi:hypothetical protein
MAVDVMRDRIRTRFLNAAAALVAKETSGFVLLLVDSMLIEYLQRLRTQQLYVERRSRALVVDFLRTRPNFQPYFDDGAHREQRCGCVACDFYSNARSGIAHDGETRNGWMVRYGEAKMLTQRGGVRVIDRNLFHAAVEAEFDLYYADLLLPSERDLRKTLKAALDGICSLRPPSAIVAAEP